MQIKLQQVLLTYLVFHLGVTCIGARKKSVLQYQNQTINESTHDINCTIFPADNNTKLKLKQLISNITVKVIFLNITMSQMARSKVLEAPVEFERSDIHFYKLFQWQLVRSDVGRNILFLFHKFRFLNLTMINIGVHDMDVGLRSEPSDCLTELSSAALGHLIRKMLLDYTADSAQQGKGKLTVCNKVIVRNQGVADFQTICYAHQPKHQISCDFLQPSQGWGYLLFFRDLIAVLTILFGPFFIPARLYTLEHAKYLHHLRKKLPVTLKITKTKLSDEPDTQNYVFSIEQCQGLMRTCPVIGIEYKATLKALYLDVDEHAILPRGCAAAEFTRVLYNKLFRCEVYSNTMKNFFRARLFPYGFQRCQKVTWNHCCRWFMNLVFFLLLPLPWCLRLLIYYGYEQTDFTDRTNAAESLNLKLPFTFDILRYIPPFHWSFLIVYSIYGADLLLFGILNFGKKELLKIIKETLRNMRDHVNLKNISFHAKSLLHPLKYFGLPGLLGLPVYLIFIIPAISIYFFIYLFLWNHLIFRLLRNIVIYCPARLLKRSSPANEAHLPRREYLINFITNCLFLLSIVSAGVLITECICYLIKTMFYAFIIIILKADNTLPYVSLGFLVIFYFFENINTVCNKYDNFQRSVCDKIIQGIDKNESDLCNYESANIAYASNDSVASITKRSNQNTTSIPLILFIDSRYRPHIPKRIFRKICRLPLVDSPGPLMISYLNAFGRFLVILVFLSFVFIVVQTYLGLYNVSSTNRMLAALAGGFLPLFIQKLIKMNANTEEIDVETIAFNKYFDKAVEEYTEDWLIKKCVFDYQENGTPQDSSENSSANCNIDQNLFVNLRIISANDKERKTPVLFH